MNILSIKGSAGMSGSNEALLKAIQKSFGEKYSIEIFDQLREFPLFRPEDLEEDLPEIVSSFKEKVLMADALLISTPEYTHNIPAVLKNAFEWCTASGEFSKKKVLPITFTPKEPRGEYAMKSLLFSLQTMDTNIVSKIPLYKTDVEFQDNECLLSNDVTALLSEGLELLG